MWIANAPKTARNKNPSEADKNGLRDTVILTVSCRLQSLYIHFLYNVPNSGELLEVNLMRPLDEVFAQTCDKIKEKLQKSFLKQTKQMLCDEVLDYEFVVSAPCLPNLLLSTNEQVYENKEFAELHINDDFYRIVRDPPRCTKLALKLKPIVECPLMATSQKVEPRFHWYVADADISLSIPQLESTSTGQSNFLIKDWTYRCSGPFFCPSIEDVGKRVCVLLDMGPDSIVQCIASDDLVSVVDEPLIFEERQSLHCEHRTDNGSIRLMSYNVLADLYLDLKLRQEDLYFPYCPKEYQDYAYRYPLLLKEIPGYNADIIFLQEVDERLWLRFLPVLMSAYNYGTHFKRKGLQVNEGLVICYRNEQFRHLESYDLWLPDFLDVAKYPENEDVVRLFESHENLKAMFVSKPAVVQVIFFQFFALHSNFITLVCFSVIFLKKLPQIFCNMFGILIAKYPDIGSEDILLLANTHLFFDPRYEIIKILQALLCARWIARIACEYATRKPELRLRILFAGDFNSTSDGAVFELLSTGSFSNRCDSLTYSKYLQDDVVFTIQPSSSMYSLKLKSLADETQFTNFTRHYRYSGEIAGFEGCLDYIWGSENIEVSFSISSFIHNYLVSMLSQKTKIRAPSVFFLLLSRSGCIQKLLY
ncbi:unnamed protein product [Gongylonema pulchrum]|uniref:Endo/exonuclease/phosphatase domain-containing protein n=1 Tax=Gongylonema pulchrum TaxID=637853 RepID=A0A183E4C5_9BILA|nr:unnamed protein product [Gongylonema pulchrum]